MKKVILTTLAAVTLAGAFYAGYEAARPEPQRPASGPVQTQTALQRPVPKPPAPTVETTDRTAPKPPPTVRTTDKPVAAKKPPVSDDPRPAADNVIQLALLLDTSGSMDGLIDQARTQLWRIVNEFARSNRNGQEPRVEVALYEYGKSSLAPGQGYVRQILPFTTELDRVSEELFALQTNGGDEYCGWVMQSALRELQWGKDKGTLKFIFIAGNEPFNQGPVDYRAVCSQALQQGVAVNTIYCGPATEGNLTGWKDGAGLARGRYLAIDQNQKIAQVSAPQDAEIARLGAELNATYVPYGSSGQVSKRRQVEQDASSAEVGSVAARTYAKASSQYKNESWDLVDAAEQKGVDAGALPAAELPAPMQAMNAPERRAFVQEKAAERKELQKRIQVLSAERDGFVQKKQKAAAGGADTLDAAIVKTVREQASSQGYRFSK